jgi:FixJ family two-component response regulator
MPHPEPKVILLVEDDVSMNRALSRTFRLSGIECVSYETPQALLDDGRASAAHCLVIDVELPGMSGFELWDELSRQGVASPVLFITAFDEPAARMRAQQARAVGFLVKPFTGRTIVDAVRHVLSAGKDEPAPG